jgi:FixJ family two-component response regulator
MTSIARLRIFVVDDDVCVADTVSVALREAGFQVTTFYDALLSVQHALLFQPDTVITDYSMPNMDGQLAAWLQEHCPGCKIVILTGDVPLVTEKADGMLKFTLLEKPAHPDALIAAVLQ